ncbi:hypothetical protein MUN88_12615 [Gracilibacillus caseinilyticus]|uniref:Competence protein CoiA n=1 Tax=Gracilibacillus caseinilyticus TaxID=2932256 RepID=A0ABY4ERX7_9BACI|nr:competence protein CoiA family protein [Gracilibacillus caseinilyticus]UOQ46933.1 hypothetical protein MUN88_12615 [Gracilibacillus caseinilyticus]
MLQAVDDTGNSVSIWNLPRDEIQLIRKQSMYCPVCKESVIVKAGMHNIPHFAHYRSSGCVHSGEGSYHEHGKLDLYLWLKHQGYQVELEHHFSELNQRADMLLHINGKKIAIEYQCATIPIDQIISRTKGYIEAGILPIWILGANKMKRTGSNSLHISTTDQSFLYQPHPSFPIRIFYYCSETKKMILYQDLLFLTRTKTIGTLQSIPLEWLTWKDLFRKKHHHRKWFAKYWKNYRQKWPHRPVSPYQKKETEWRQWLYLRKLTVHSLPDYVYLPIRSQYLMMTQPWIWQSLLYVELFKKREHFSLQQAALLVQHHVHSTEYFPLLSLRNDPVFEYLQLLVRIGILKDNDKNHYDVNRTTV